MLLLRSDATEMPFSALLPPEKLCRTVVLMHHKRLPELEATLRRLASTPLASELVVHVAQSLRASEAEAANATGALVHSLAKSLPLRGLLHAPAVLPEVEPDGSYSVNAARYGTKKNSFRNMVHAMHAGFRSSSGSSHGGGSSHNGGGGSGGVSVSGGGGPPGFVIVMEDDVEVSTDLLEYFDFAASLMDATRALAPPRRVELASSFCILRKGHRDYGFKGWLPGDWLPLRADRYRRMPVRDVTFKTFAWLASRDVYEAMVRDTDSMFAMGGAETALHSSLAGCPYCANFCYDHYLEWRWRNASVTCPEVPRSRQYVLGGGGGMTETPGSVASEYHALERSGTELNAKFVQRWQHTDGAHRQRARRLLNGVALWALPTAAALLAVKVALGARGRRIAAQLMLPTEHAAVSGAGKAL